MAMMRTTNFCRLLAGLLAGGFTFLASSARADTPAFLLGSVLSKQPVSFTGTRGWQFGIANGGSDILITKLGVFDSGGDGLVNSHEIGLWLNNPNNPITGTLLVSATVPAGTIAPLEAGYRWVSITPVRIPYAVAAYSIGAQYSAGDADDLVTPRPPGSTLDYQFAPHIRPVLGTGGKEAFGDKLQYPAASASCGEGCTPEIFWEPNLQYVVVPEPSVWLLLVLGLACLLLSLAEKVVTVSPFWTLEFASSRLIKRDRAQKEGNGI